MTTAETAPSARASTHAWCTICRDATPTVDRPLAETSPRRRLGFEGATLHCLRCGMQHATIYVCEEARSS